MTHNLRLHPEPFALIKSGKKSIESRLYDGKRQTFQVGDILIFISRADNSEIKTIITDIHRYSAFSILFSSHPLDKFGNKNLPELLEEIESFYPKAVQEKYGVIGIEFKIINNT
ncbi:MAG: ASCH domain protein [Parcubacteria bacterium OLB19]|nr:MAG: ASCH domain protein [Parcubacteria bacterium OLB19]